MAAMAESAIATAPATEVGSGAVMLPAMEVAAAMSKMSKAIMIQAEARRYKPWCNWPPI